MPPFPSTCDIYRPFGDATPTESDVPCRLVPNFASGQRGDRPFSWTHYIELAADADVRDGCSRPLDGGELTYADGDEVRIGTTRYAVVWVELHDRDGVMAFRRAYLLRHEVTWPEL